MKANKKIREDITESKRAKRRDPIEAAERRACRFFSPLKKSSQLFLALLRLASYHEDINETHVMMRLKHSTCQICFDLNTPNQLPATYSGCFLNSLTTVALLFEEVIYKFASEQVHRPHPISSTLEILMSTTQDLGKHPVRGERKDEDLICSSLDLLTLYKIPHGRQLIDLQLHRQRNSSWPRGRCTRSDSPATRRRTSGWASMGHHHLSGRTGKLRIERYSNWIKTALVASTSGIPCRDINPGNYWE
jgi:hypothetical protein